MDSSNEGLLYEGSLPVSFQPIECFPGEGQLALVNEKNENFLKTSLTRHESMEVDEHDEISLELRRQDLKINLLLDMVGELLVQTNKLPAEVMLRLTATGLEYDGDSAAHKAGDKLEIALYISPSTPRALKLYGEVLTSDADSIISIGFIGVSQAVQDWLEKFIFRHHRRIIAQGRVPI